MKNDQQQDISGQVTRGVVDSVWYFFAVILLVVVGVMGFAYFYVRM